jgi:hypothetical protein
VAETEEEKAPSARRPRHHDHLIRNEFNLIDHAGTDRWGRFGPDYLIPGEQRSQLPMLLSWLSLK